MASAIASGKDRDGFRASPPACAIESKPMKLANNTAAAVINVLILNVPFTSGIWTLPSLASKPAAKSSCVKKKPAIITMAPRKNIKNISGITIRSYNLVPWILTITNVHNIKPAKLTRTQPVSSKAAVSCQSNANAISLMKGTIT